jgi:acetylornithine/succinyldiaminopimelate/putrescine aminotransferase
VLPGDDRVPVVDLAVLRRLCDETGALLMFDEIQTAWVAPGASGATSPTAISRLNKTLPAE